MLKRIFVLRRLLLSAGFFAGLLVFWLPAHEVFDAPKSTAFLTYSSLLLALSLPLLPGLADPRLRPFLIVGGSLLAAVLASLVNAQRLLPSNTLLSIEKIAPMIAAALSAMVFMLEEPSQRRRIIFSVLACHALMVFYGLMQLLDQTLGHAIGIPIDLIRWTSFGESRVYSTLGNPDYMAAQITLFLPIWLSLDWRDPRLNLRGMLVAASLLLLCLPLGVVFLVYGLDGNLWVAVMKAYPLWAISSLGLFVLARKLPRRVAWLGLAYLSILLIIVAQGRGAYLGLAVSLALMLALAWRVAGRAVFEAHRLFFLRNGMVLGIGLSLLAAAYGLRSASPQNGILNLAPVRASLKASDALVDRVQNLFDRHSDAQVVRKFYYAAAIQMATEHPFFGIGYGNHALFTARAQTEVWKRWESQGNPSVNLVEPHVELYTHNDFLQNLAETGTVGLLAFLAFWGWLIYRAYQLTRLGWQDRRARMGIGLLGMSAAFVASALFNFPWRVLASQQWCWLAFSWLAVSEIDGGTVHAPSRPAFQRSWLMVVAAGLAFSLALFPVRWFYASSLFKQGNQGRDRNAFAEGAAFYQKAVDVGLSGTQRVELYLYLGSMFNMLNRSDLAESWFLKACEIYPAFIEAQYNLGYTWMTRYQSSHLEADRKEAAFWFEKVLSTDPRYANALNNLGNLYYAVRDYARSAEVYERLLRYAPNTLEARYNLGATYLMLNRRQDAEIQLNDALKLKPDYAPVLQLLKQIKALPQGQSVRLK